MIAVNITGIFPSSNYIGQVKTRTKVMTAIRYNPKP